MKTLGTRKRERRAAAAAAEQAQSVSSAVPANQMRKPKCRKGIIKAYLCVVVGLFYRSTLQTERVRSGTDVPFHSSLYHQ